MLFGRKPKKTAPKLRENRTFRFPAEEDPHEGTWLQWPHDYGWDDRHVERYEPTWVAMTQALHTGERVHIVVYNEHERERVRRVLEEEEMDLDQIDFFCWPTDDVWVRDNGPMFVYENSDENRLHITNWAFNAWGCKSEWWYDNYIPLKVGHALELPVIDVPMVHEGGSMEIDGRGTFLAKKTCILNDNRNPGWTQADAEAYFRRYFGVSNFIWLPGKCSKEDITDDHIDGTARFANGDTIVTFYKEDFDNPKEYQMLQKAVDVDGEPYKIVHLPCTKRKLKKLNDYGIYINYYVGNEVVLVPSFGDPNDEVAAEKLQRLYPSRQVVGIPCTELFQDGGLVHCVTQQEPAEL